jgi:hypothetical protein
MDKHNILAKLRPNNNKQVKTVERIAAIGNSCEAIGWRPIAYELPNRFVSFQKNLTKNLNDCLATANPDIYNAHYYDENIDMEVQIALQELDSKRIDHIRNIHNIRIYQEASKLDIENQLHELEKNLLKNKEELANV